MNGHKPDSRIAKKRKFVFPAILILILAVVCALPLLFGFASNDATIRIPANATSAQLRDSIAKYLGDSYADKTMRFVRVFGTEFHDRHGAYLIEKGTLSFSAARKLMRGGQHPVRLTINGFRKESTLIEKVSAKFDFSADSLEKALASPQFLRESGHTRRQAMVIFVDDTYDFYWSDSPRHVVDVLRKNYEKLWNDERRGKAAALGLSADEIMIVASIVDEETNKQDEKGRIGRLYINRLKRGMKLQADPTVRFALDDFTIKRVTANHLKVNSPYNTYRYAGLPPGPIRTTSVRTIDAILDSSPSDDIYMCAKEDFSGYHNFASDYAGHQVNARRYQQQLDRQGIH